MRRSPAARLVRTLAAGLLVSAPFALSACAFTPASAEDRAEAVVSEFFELLESGDAEGIVPLLTEDSALRSGDSELLSNDFYARVVAHPTKATVVTSGEYKPGIIYVTVDYLIGTDSQKRTIKIAVEDQGGTALISSWRKDTLSVVDVTLPGTFEVNDSFQTADLNSHPNIVALPGVYTFTYVDSEGWGTLDPRGNTTEPFDVEFPVDGDQLADNVPAGATSTNSTITAEPRLTTTAARAVEDALSDMATDCAEANLSGDACPAAISAKAASRGAPDDGSVTWKDSSLGRIVPGDTWLFEGRYTFNFETDGRQKSVWADITGTIKPDGQGNPTLSFNDAP